MLVKTQIVKFKNIRDILNINLQFRSLLRFKPLIAAVSAIIIARFGPYEIYLGHEEELIILAALSRRNSLCLNIVFQNIVDKVDTTVAIFLFTNEVLKVCGDLMLAPKAD